jgi:hypothetical protein
MGDETHKLWRDAIKSATSLGVHLTSTPEERKGREEAEERRRVAAHLAAEQAAARREAE